MDLFLKSPGSFSGAESYFVFAVFTFKFKVSIILTMIVIVKDSRLKTPKTITCSAR